MGIISEIISEVFVGSVIGEGFGSVMMRHCASLPELVWLAERAGIQT